MRAEDPNAYRKFWKSLKPRNSINGPTLSQFVKYFEQQVYTSCVDYFDYDHMNYIIKQVASFPTCFNPFKPEFTIVNFTHYKPRIAVAIRDL